MTNGQLLTREGVADFESKFWKKNYEDNSVAQSITY